MSKPFVASSPFVEENFFDALKAGAVAFVQDALQQTPQLAQLKSGSKTALMCAVLGGSVECVQALLPMSSLEAMDQGGRTALMWAADKGQAAMVRLLLPGSPTAIAAQHEQLSPFMLAARSGRLECLLLLRPASDPNEIGLHGANALMWAVFGEHVECVRLLAKESHLQHINNNGQTALVMSAMDSHRIECLRVLLPYAMEHPEEREKAFELALEKKAWECADALAATLGPEHATRLLGVAPIGTSLPLSHTLCEREALRQDIEVGTPSSIRPWPSSASSMPPSASSSGNKKSLRL